MNPIPLAWCLLLAAAGANRIWAEPDPPSEPFVPPAHRDTTVRFLGEFERGPMGWGGADRYLGVSPDGLHVAALSEAGDGRKQGSCVVARDGVPGARYDGVPRGCGWISIIFSRDSAHLAYPARRGDAWFVVVDGNEEGPYENVGAESLTFSPDSTRLAYAARRGGKPLIVVNGRAEEAPGDAWNLQFDRSGRRLAYFVTYGDGGCCLVVDGKPGKRYEAMCMATYESEDDERLFTPVGDRAVEIGRTGTNWTVTVEGQKPWTAAGAHTIYYRLSRDGARGVARAYQDGESAFSPDGKRLAQWVGRGHDAALALDGRDLLTYHVKHGWDSSYCSAPVFSPDGSHWAARAHLPTRRDDGVTWEDAIVVDGKEAMRSPSASLPVFSPNGKRWAYCARVGDCLNGYVNGERVAVKETKHAADPLDRVYHPFRDDVAFALFSPDSRRVAFAMGCSTNDVRVFLDDKEVGRGDAVAGLMFSPDSAHLLWCAKDGDTWRAVMDGQPGIGFAAALTHAGGEANGPSDPVFHFAVPGRVNFLVALTPADEDGGGKSSAYLVTERLGEQRGRQ